MDTLHHSLHTFLEMNLDRSTDDVSGLDSRLLTQQKRGNIPCACLHAVIQVELESAVLFCDEHHVTQIHWKRIGRLRFHIWKLTALVKFGTWIILGVNRNYSKFLWQQIGDNHENEEFWRAGKTIELRESTMRVVYNSSVYRSWVTQKLIETVPGMILG